MQNGVLHETVGMINMSEPIIEKVSGHPPCPFWNDYIVRSRLWGVPTNTMYKAFPSPCLPTYTSTYVPKWSLSACLLLKISATKKKQCRLKWYYFSCSNSIGWIKNSEVSRSCWSVPWHRKPRQMGISLWIPIWHQRCWCSVQRTGLWGSRNGCTLLWCVWQRNRTHLDGQCPVPRDRAFHHHVSSQWLGQNLLQSWCRCCSYL